MSSLSARVRSQLREVAESRARRTTEGRLTGWSLPLIGEVPAEGGADLLTDPLFGPQGDPGSARSRRRAPDLTGAPLCLLVTSQLDFGGLAEVVGLLAMELPSHGLRVAVLGVTPRDAGQRSGQIAEVLRARGIQVIEAAEAAVPACIAQLAPDVISAHGAPLSVFAAAERARVPFVDNLHGMYSVYGDDWRWHREAIYGGTLVAVVVVSNLLRSDYLAGNPGFPPSRVVAIPNAVGSGQRAQADRGLIRKRLGLSEEFIFVSLARYSLEKNTYGLVAAFAELAARRPEAHLVLAGRSQDARYLSRVVRLCDSLPCAERIHLRQHTTGPGELLAAADGFVLDSFHEGGPISSMEALCAGVPVVLSDVGSAREQVGDDPARGLVVGNPLGAPLPVSWEMVAAARFRPQANQGELTDAMERLVAGREQYAKNRDRLSEESRRRFSAEVCVAQHAQVLAAAASGES